jgi:hypothetical protein
MSTASLRPLTTGELLDHTFALYKEHFGLFVGIVALPHLLSLGFGLVSLQLRSYLGLGAFAWALITMLVVLIVGAISQAATVVAVSEVYLARSTSVVDSYSRVQFSLVGVIFLSLVIGITVGVSTIFFVIPGILLAMKWSLAVPAAVLEDQGIVDSMSRSAALTKDYRWRVFAVWILFFVLSMCVSLLLQWPIRLASLAALRNHSPAGLPWLRAASSGLTFLSQCLVRPLATIAFSLLYYDLRVRKEAFDLQLMMETLDGRESAGPQPSSALS